ncbi:MAG: RC-LH1 core complex protein PufX [Alphaproteobacteria bacterium]
MSDHHYINDQSEVIRLRTWGLGQMVWGAFVAAMVLAVIAGLLLAVWGVSLLLPEQSKQAPSPYASMEIATQIEVV